MSEMASFPWRDWGYGSIQISCPLITTAEQSGMEGSFERSLDKSINSHRRIFSISFVGIGAIPSTTIIDADVDGEFTV